MLTKKQSPQPHINGYLKKSTTNNVEKSCNLYYIKTMFYIAKFRVIPISDISGFNLNLNRVILQKCSAFQIPVKTRKIQKFNLCSISNDTVSQMMISPLKFRKSYWCVAEGCNSDDRKRGGTTDTWLM